ncbi:MAG: Swt1 family HEPN domain-containing protein [Limnochordia bacterium]
MALTNHERVGKALELLKEGIAPFVERELQAQYGKYWITRVTRSWPNDLVWSGDEDEPHLDVALLLRLMWEQWNDIFRKTLGQAERSLVSELREVRNRWAHQTPFSSDDAHRALDSASRLLTAISAPQAAEVDRLRMELLRLRFEEQARHERRKSATNVIEGGASAHLKPWREVITPHHDVASGNYQQAEFAADLWQVHLGQGSDEYKDPVEFFRRTYLTESLRRLLVGGIKRLKGLGGDPVVQLQTNFGGGKTHSMLALYHLCSGIRAGELLGVDSLLDEADLDELPTARRVVLVGNRISPGNPVTKPDGTVVRTLWGELAWQLGGKEAFARVQADDELGTSPGDALRLLFDEYGPCLVLIDEWVAYARQLHDHADLPAGSFETQFTFAQALTESAKLARQCLLVISLPASDTTASPHTQADDAEVGGLRGREALNRLQNVVGRIESSWRPASAEESFEIVRRRLFEPLVEREQFVARDTVARAFYELYRTQHQEFPATCHDSEYETRLKAAYPIHPEVFDRLYTDWSTLLKFQRTRGVLRLMAAVIHSLWEKGDRNPLILPASIPIDDPRVQRELTRYLSDNWVPVIEKDVDGSTSLPLRIDAEVPNLGKFSACRRVARTIYMGSAPTHTAANRGLDDGHIKLGCVMPGESPTVFGDALRRLAASATYLYQDGSRYWYSTQPTVTKLADDRAEQMRREPEAIAKEVRERLRLDMRQTGDFCRVHLFPLASQDVPDDLDTRLVILGLDHPHSRGADTPAQLCAQEILESRGSAPRLYRNTLVFMAPDKSRLQDLDEAVRRYLAWRSIVADQAALDLTPHQVRQAETQEKAADDAVTARIPEAYQWLLVPIQETPQSTIVWESFRLSGQDALAVRASRKLCNDELLVVSLAGTRLRMDLDRVPLWRGNHVAVRQLIEDYARYPYLSRLKSPDVLLGAIGDGMSLLHWRSDAFAYADSFDESSGRYLGLRTHEQITLASSDPRGLLVHPDIAARQLEAERVKVAPPTSEPPDVDGCQPGGHKSEDKDESSTATTPAPLVLSRFHGGVALDPLRVGRDAGRIADEVICHLAALPGAEVEVTLEISVKVPDGVPDDVVRIVTENSRTLKFRVQGFEER